MATPDATQPLQPDQPAPATLAVGAADASTSTVQDTPLEGGMKVITTPQGKASVDKNAPESVTGAFDAAAQPSPASVPVFDDSGKRIVGTTGLRADPAKHKGSYIVANSMVTTAAGRSYVAGEFIDPADLTGDDIDLLTSGDSPAIVKN